MQELIKDTKVLMLDLDGTVYLENDLIGDVKLTLQYMRDKGIQLVYLTNNSSKTDDEYLVKLKTLDIYKEGDIFYSSLDAAIDYLKENYSGKTVYPLACKGVEKYIEESGFPYSYDADILLMTFDRDLNYQKIVRANELMCEGKVYIATHPDATCPAKGWYVPDVGSFIKMFESSSGRLPDVIVGKPYSVMADMLVKRLNVNRENITMVGDRLNTDVAFGKNNGFNSVVVLTGVTTYEQAKEAKEQDKVDLILDDINCLKNFI